ncbi:MAG: winged helix-turn-helix domain-containing protein [Gammaproteobacteria bacterium]
MSALLATTYSLAEYRRIQSIYFRARYGYSAPQIAELVGLKTQISTRMPPILAYGEAALQQRSKGGRYHFNLALAEEEQLLESFMAKSRIGELVGVSQVQRAYEAKLGHRVAKSTVYRLLHRQGWRKVVPRGHHPKGDPVQIERFKKTSAISLPTPERKPSAEAYRCG